LGKHEKEIVPLSAMKPRDRNKMKICFDKVKTPEDKQFIANVLKQHYLLYNMS